MLFVRLVWTDGRVFQLINKSTIRKSEVEDVEL